MSNVVAQSRVGDPVASGEVWEAVGTLRQCQLVLSVPVLLLHQDLEALGPDSEVGLAAGEEASTEEASAVTADLVDREEVSDIKVVVMDLVVKPPPMPLLVLEVDEVADMVGLMNDAVVVVVVPGTNRQAAIGNR
jgi:hypothetical protein